jgi:hypothetical protein
MPFVPIIDEQQRRQALDLLAEGFPRSEISWALAFKAPQGQGGHGLLLLADGQPQGCMLTFEKKETIRGRERRIVNLSSWFIRPHFRTLALRMLRAVMADANAVYTTCTPIISVQRIALHIGFHYVSHGSIASVPFINGLSLLSRVTIEPFTPTEVRDAQHRRWMVDHGGLHIRILIRQGSNTVPILWLRGLKVRGLPAARLIFTSDHNLLRTALPAIHWYIFKNHGIVGLYLPRICPYADLRSLRKHHRGPSMLLKGDLEPEDVNLLYSELTYLYSGSG